MCKSDMSDMPEQLIFPFLSVESSICEGSLEFETIFGHFRLQKDQNLLAAKRLMAVSILETLSKSLSLIKQFLALYGKRVEIMSIRLSLGCALILRSL